MEHMEEALEVCLETVTRNTYETNQRFLLYVESLRRRGYRSFDAFARSSESYDPSWFTPEIKADVRLLRVVCADAVFVAGINQIIEDDLKPEELHRRVESALCGRGMLCDVSHGQHEHMSEQLRILLTKLQHTT